MTPKEELDRYLEEQDPVEWGETEYPAMNVTAMFEEMSDDGWAWLGQAWRMRSARWLENLAWALAEAPAERAVPLLQSILAEADHRADYYWVLRDSLEELTGGPKHQVSLADLKQLMARSGCGLHDCRFALAETGSVEAALELLVDDEAG